MGTLLIDFGSNSFKVGTSPQTAVKVFGVREGVLNPSAGCRRVRGGVEVCEEGPIRLSEVLAGGRKALPESFLVSQPMDFEMKKDNFLGKTFEVYFEKLGMQRGQTWLQPLLSFYACRHLVDRNMLLVDSGEDATYFIPFYDDFILRDSIQRCPLAGGTLTSHFLHFLGRNGYRGSPASSSLALQFLKEDSVEVCPDFARFSSAVIERENFYWRRLQLPDGGSVTLKKEVFEIPESLFRPSDFGLGGQGLPHKLFGAIKVV